MSNNIDLLPKYEYSMLYSLNDYTLTKFLKNIYLKIIEILMNTSLKKYNSFRLLTITVVLLSSGLFTSCFESINLVTLQKQHTKYEFIGYTISVWSLTRNEHSWGF